MVKFETNESHSKKWHQPVRVPVNRQDVFSAARNMVADIDGWEVSSVDEDAHRITCECRNGFLGGTSTIVVTVNGPDGIPNSETHCSSESQGAIISRDRGNVAEFVRKFWMRMT